MASLSRHTTPMRTNTVKLWFQILSGFLFLAVATGVQAANTCVTPVPYPSTGSLSPSEARKLIGEHKHLIVIDVRSREEFEQGHVPGARSFPIHDLSDNLKLVPAGPVLLLCRTGRRAERAYNLIHDARPSQQLWYLEGRPTYFPDGTYSFQ